MSTSKIPFTDNSILQPKRLQATAKISAMLHAAVDVALHIPLGNILALIVMLLAARRSVLDLRRLVPCLYASPVRPRARRQTICRQGRGKSVSVTYLGSGIHNRQQGAVRALFEGFHDTLLNLLRLNRTVSTIPVINAMISAATMPRIGAAKVSVPK